MILSDGIDHDDGRFDGTVVLKFLLLNSRILLLFSYRRVDRERNQLDAMRI